MKEGRNGKGEEREEERKKRTRRRRRRKYDPKEGPKILANVPDFLEMRPCNGRNSRSTLWGNKSPRTRTFVNSCCTTHEAAQETKWEENTTTFLQLREKQKKEKQPRIRKTKSSVFSNTGVYGLGKMMDPYPGTVWTFRTTLLFILIWHRGENIWNRWRKSWARNRFKMQRIIGFRIKSAIEKMSKDAARERMEVYRAKSEQHNLAVGKS